MPEVQGQRLLFDERFAGGEKAAWVQLVLVQGRPPRSVFVWTGVEDKYDIQGGLWTKILKNKNSFVAGFYMFILV
jgi:hypothetical protein